MAETSTSNTNKLAAIAISSTLFVLYLSGLSILNGGISQPIAGGPLRHDVNIAAPLISFADLGPGATGDEAKPYYIFLQKFPLKHTFKSIFHTEVILCPKQNMDIDFANILDGVLATLEPSRFSTVNQDRTGPSLNTEEKDREPFAEIAEVEWSTQNGACIQLGYAGSSCQTPCCSVPHTAKNVAYALNSRTAVISNVMGEYKQLFLYGETQLNDGANEAFEAVCHGHYGAVEVGKLPVCVSNWAGTDYNPITNNCNTFTSTVLKCVFGLTDTKPSLWISDLMNVECPTKKGETGQGDIRRCVAPSETVDRSEFEYFLLESE